MTTRFNKHIAFGLAISLIGHSLLLWWWTIPTPPHDTTRLTPPAEIAFVLTQPANPMDRTTAPSAETEPLEEVLVETEEPAPNLPAIPPPPPGRAEVVTPAPTKNPGNLNLSRPANAAREKAWSMFNTPTCRERERLNPMLVCQDDAPAVQRPMAELVANLSTHLAPTNNSIKHQLDRAEQLIRQADRLAALDPDDPAEAAQIRAQQQHLRSELLRIDQQLASVNLLRVLPMAAKVARGLRDARE